jgi:hypothetical protein
MRYSELGRQRFPEPVGFVTDYLVTKAELVDKGKIVYRGSALLTEIGGPSIDATVEPNKIKVKWGAGTKEYSDYDTLMEICHARSIGGAFQTDYPLFLQPVAHTVAKLFGNENFSKDASVGMMSLPDPDTSVPLHVVGNITPSQLGGGRLGTVALLSTVYANKMTPLFPDISSYVEAHDLIADTIINEFRDIYETFGLDGLYPVAETSAELLSGLESSLNAIREIKSPYVIPQPNLQAPQADFQVFGK